MPTIRIALAVLEGRSPAAGGERAADDGDPYHDEQDRRPDMGEGEHHPGEEAVPRPSLAPKVIGHEHTLAVPRHQGMQCAEEHGGTEQRRKQRSHPRRTSCPLPFRHRANAAARSATACQLHPCYPGG